MGNHYLTDEYLGHNGKDALTSTDPNVRLYGRCGCGSCLHYRMQQAAMPAPINRPGREGANSMSGINVCDRCGALVKGIALGQIQIRTSADYKTSEVIDREVCPGCIEELLPLIEMEMLPREKAYKNAFVRQPSEDSVDAATAEQLAAALFEKLMNQQKAITTTES